MEQFNNIVATISAILISGGIVAMVQMYSTIKTMRRVQVEREKRMNTLEIESIASRRRLTALADAMIENYLTQDAGKKLKREFEAIDAYEDLRKEELIKKDEHKNGG